MYKILSNNPANYYKIGFISPNILYGINKPPPPLCNHNTTCGTKGFSMCRFPTNYNSRLYFDSEWKYCKNCDRYLHKV